MVLIFYREREFVKFQRNNMWQKILKYIFHNTFAYIIIFTITLYLQHYLLSKFLYFISESEQINSVLESPSNEDICANIIETGASGFDLPVECVVCKIL